MFPMFIFWIVSYFCDFGMADLHSLYLSRKDITDSVHTLIHSPTMPLPTLLVRRPSIGQNIILLLLVLENIQNLQI